MLERKLIVDRFIDLSNPNSSVPANSIGTFADHPITLLTMEQSTGIAGPEDHDPTKMTKHFSKTRISSIASGQGQKQHRNFQWLSWWPGMISQVRCDSVDILTGPMSGCWVVVYKINGITHVGHVGTEGGSEKAKEKSATVKECWNKFARENPNDVISGFQPNRYWDDNNGAKKPATITNTANYRTTGDQTGNSERIYGLVAPNGDFFTMFLYRQHVIQSRYRIAGFEPITPIIDKTVLMNI